MPRRTTTAVNGNCGQQPRIARSRAGSAQSGGPICSPPFGQLLVRQHDKDARRIRRSALSWTGKPSFSRVEQLPSARHAAPNVLKVSTKPRTLAGCGKTPERSQFAERLAADVG